jgi:hypothetical protein
VGPAPTDERRDGKAARQRRSPKIGALNGTSKICDEPDSSQAVFVSTVISYDA